MAEDRLRADTIQGHCPACGWASLFVGEGGCLTCSRLECPQPDAAHRILADRETEHVVQFDDEGFTVRHPLRERLDDALMRCELHPVLHLAVRSTIRPGAVPRRGTPRGLAVPADRRAGGRPCRRLTA